MIPRAVAGIFKCPQGVKPEKNSNFLRFFGGNPPKFLFRGVQLMVSISRQKKKQNFLREAPFEAPNGVFKEKMSVWTYIIGVRGWRPYCTAIGFSRVEHGPLGRSVLVTFSVFFSSLFRKNAEKVWNGSTPVHFLSSAVFQITKTITYSASRLTKSFI